MTTPKPVKAWAVFDPIIGLSLQTINPNKRISIYNMRRQVGFLEWKHLYRKGYRCIPVVITPEKKG